MAVKKPSPKQTSGSYDLADIRVLAKMLNQYDLSELEVEYQGQRVRVRRERGATAPALVSPTPMIVSPPPSIAVPAPVKPVVEAAPEPDGTTTIVSPFVGTFYRAPAPEAPPFVEAGQNAKKGQVLCIVEAMKLMNEIEADMDCKIVEILVKNADPVEFSQALFKVIPIA